VEQSQNNHKNALTQRLASHQHLIEKVSEPEKQRHDGGGIVISWRFDCICSLSRFLQETKKKGYHIRTALPRGTQILRH